MKKLSFCFLDLRKKKTEYPLRTVEALANSFCKKQDEIVVHGLITDLLANIPISYGTQWQIQVASSVGFAVAHSVTPIFQYNVDD